MAYGKSMKGVYTPRHPNKYKGNVNNIRYMSSWEYKFHQFLDNNPNILEWNSEEIAIPYVKPTTGRVHRYFPDYWIKYRNKNGDVVEEIIEIKPAAQTKPPTTRGKKKQTQINEQITWAINVAKWQQAQVYCKKHGFKFRIVTENMLFK